jgi:hypothetical protein
MASLQAGSMTIGGTGNIVPNTNDTYTIGNATKAYKYLYLVDDATSQIYLCAVVNGKWVISPQ